MRLGRRSGVVVVAVLCLVGTACGTRLPDSAFTASGAEQASGPGARRAGADQALASDQQPAGTPVADANGPGAVNTPTGNTPTGNAPSNGTPTGARKGATPGQVGADTGGGVSGPNTASDVGITPTSVTVGNVTAIGGALGPDAFGPTLRGLKVYFAALNARGGVGGRKIDFQTCDDNEDGQSNLACTKKLVEQQNVFALIGNNSLASARSANYEFTHGVPDIGFPLNTGYYKYPNMFTVYGSPYPRDGKQIGINGTLYDQTTAYRWFKQSMHVSRAAVFFYQVDVSAQQGYNAEQALKTEGIQTVYEGGGHQGEPFAKPSFDDDVTKMKNLPNPPEAVWDAIDTAANQRLCQSMDRLQFQVKAKVSTIEVWGQDVGDSWSAPCRNSVFVTGQTASYAETGLAPVAQFRADMNKYGPQYKLHQWVLEGYALGRMFADALTSMGAAPTRAGLMKWLNSLHDYTNGGFYAPMDYLPKDITKQRRDCNTYVQWQDSAGTFVTRNPLDNCFVTPFYPHPVSPDGA